MSHASTTVGMESRQKTLRRLLSTEVLSEAVPGAKIGQSSLDGSLERPAVSIDPNSRQQEQKAYRIHFSVIDKNRSWTRGTKRSFRWYEPLWLLECVLLCFIGMVAFHSLCEIFRPTVFYLRYHALVDNGTKF